MGTPIFVVKRASNSQDTVDYIVQRAATKNSSGFPGLTGQLGAGLLYFTSPSYIFYTPMACKIYPADIANILASG